MRIFATSDIHGNMALIAKLKEMAPICDIILICGDVGGKARNIFCGWPIDTETLKFEKIKEHV